MRSQGLRTVTAVFVLCGLVGCGSGPSSTSRPHGGRTATSTASSAATTATSPAPTAPRPRRVLVVGDSLALLLGFGLTRTAAAHGWEVRGAAVLGCGILPGTPIRYGVPESVDERCGHVPDTWQRAITELDPHLVVVLDGFWDAYDWMIDGHPVAFGTPEWDAYAIAHVTAAVDRLSAGGADVLWLLSPYFRPDRVDPSIQRYHDEHGEYRSALDDDRVRHLNELFRRVAAERPCTVTVVDARQCICPDDAYADVVEGLDVRGDGVHLTDEGADRLAEYVIPRARLALAGDC